MQKQRWQHMISRTSLTVPWWKVLFPFQSWGQFQSWAWINCIVAIIALLAIYLLGEKSIPALVLLPGILLGSLPSVISVLPAKLTVRADLGFGKSASIISTKLEGIGYTVESTSNNVMVFRQNLPRYFRWKEGEVTIRNAQQDIIVFGAYATVALIAKHLRTACESNWAASN